MLWEQIVIDFPGDSPLSHKLLPKMAVFTQPLGLKRVSTEMILPSTWCRVEAPPSQVPCSLDPRVLQHPHRQILFMGPPGLVKLTCCY